MKRRRLLLPLLVLVAARFAFAQALPPGLATHPQWLALLHINQGATLHSRRESYVDDDAFFLHPEGKSDPHAELVATMAALAPDGAPARCRFPARYRFLATQLGWDRSPAAFDHCDAYRRWRAEVPAASVVLVFPAAYLNSPSSMFGHTLLRLDHEQEPDSAWQSWAVNFGARVSAEDNDLLYLYRGVFGGYPGYFVTVPYATKIREYSHLENRDMWEYRLELERDGIARLVDHLWELRDVRFDYYFLDENCSFRLLELVQVARPDLSLTADFRLAEVPVNTVRVLREQGVIGHARYRPSKAVELRRDIARLAEDEKELALRLLADPDVAASPDFDRRAPERRHLVARVAYNTLRHRHRDEQRDAAVARRSLALLRLMHENPPPAAPPPAQPVPPEAGHGTQLLAVAGGQRESVGFGELRYRFTYHDLLDNAPGFLHGAQIAALDLTVRQAESGTAEIETLDLLHIRSLAPRDRFTRTWSWFGQAGLERVTVAQRRRLARFIEGGIGLATESGPALPYGFAMARLENNGVWAPWLQGGAGMRAGSLWRFGALTADTGVEGIWFGNDEYRHRWNLDINIALGRSSAIRLAWEREGWRGEGDNEVGIAWLHYFD